jgi:putative heme-binding domain-containing protein
MTNGLALWLDVSRQNAARGAHELAPLRSWSDAPDYLFDGSGNRRHLNQPLLEARPRFRQEFNGAFLSFDGTNDFLTVSGLNVSLSNVTVFAVAAPKQVGGYRALLAFNHTGRNDYTSGLNLDLGSAPDTRLARINAEGAGFPGEANLLATPQPLGQWHVFELIVGSGPDGVKLVLDGQPQNARIRNAGVLRLDEFTLGARHYSNTPDRPFAQNFFDGDLAELLMFDHVLPDAERASVERYLDAKYGALLHGLEVAPVPEGTVPLATVANPPPVQVHFPGFSARELPVELNNINNVHYRPDGKLVGVGYDGRIWRLSDTDGDGLEDKVEPFWDKQTIRAPIGAALTPPGYALGQGVFVAGKEKVALVVDTNGDDKADEEITVASWPEHSEQHGVDALGVAVAPDGSIYFSLGTASFTEPFLIDKATGQARYRTSMQRGTIQRVSPDFSKRETVCTGIRFAVGMAFNRNGDLFVTDQEGATWLPNGNPFDELLHIQPGRHYGFPPRHPKHLPEVIDEPSVFDYMPQHQSTCGLCFNEPGPQLAAGVAPVENRRQDAGGRNFGPAEWAGEALVTGYSRGKLWRTKLVKTAEGYVAQSHLLATLQLLTVDACVSPRGDLIVATHSGQPDWGSGPNGKGKLWRIRYDDRDWPQPVAVWNADPTELKVAFDRALDAEALKGLSKSARVESGKYVFAGDRFESIRPGYQVVYDQLSAPRYTHEVLSTSVSPDRRTLTLVTRPRTVAVNYAVTLPHFGSRTEPAPVASREGIAKDTRSSTAPSPPGGKRSGSHEVMDLLTGLTGIEAHWESAQGRESWVGWIPHPNLEVAREFTRGSAEHERLFELLAKSGTLVLRGQLDLYQMLQPAIQPGAAIDWERPKEDVTVRFESGVEFIARLGTSNSIPVRREGGIYLAESRVSAPGQRWQPFEARMPTGGQLTFRAAWSTTDDPRARAFPLRRFFMPFAQPENAPAGVPAGRVIPEIAGGNWLQGKRLFFSDKLACMKCHAIRGEGQHVGPDLSNLLYRDYASVRKDLEFPNAAINPDHVASVIELADGDLATGIVQYEQDGVLQVVTGAGAVEKIARTTVKSIKPAELSLMPEGLWEPMTETERRDLMTFLLTAPLEPHPLPLEVQGQKLPPPRKRSEIEAVLAASHESDISQRGSTNESQRLAQFATPMRIVLCASEKDPGHGAPGFHDYPLWRERWGKLLSLADGVTIETADRWPGAEQWQRADVIAFNHDNPAWTGEKAGELDAFLERGGGLVFLHWSCNAYGDHEALAQRLGKSWGPGAKFRYGVEDLTMGRHAITAGLDSISAGQTTAARLRFTDEAYWNLPGSGAGTTVLATSVEEGAPQPQVWIRTQGKGRVFVCIPGHFTWTFDDPLYRILVLRGMTWAAGQPVDRFNELATIGARMAE